MAKVRRVYVCMKCGEEHAKWGGRCSSCREWNCLEEQIVDKRSAGSFGFGKQARKEMLASEQNQALRIGDIESHSYKRVALPMPEFSRVLGGGVVPGSLILVGGDPGIGKSTLLGQVSGLLADVMGSVLYISGEESIYQVKMRVERLGVKDKELFLLSETNLNRAIEEISKLKPKAVILDSIQTVYLQEVSSSAGSVSQVRECASRLMMLAKNRNIPVFMVGHVTKDGAIAGPRVLEHIVDTVLYLEGDRFHSYRILRAQKNRFGSTNEVGIFEMRQEGMIEVSNPSEAFLGEHASGKPGSAVAVTMEGTRPILVEIQALVSHSSYAQAKRTANGIDLNRLHLLLAVLSKRMGIQLERLDVFVNVVGGLKLREPAADLAIAAALTSSYFDIPLPTGLALIGEIGLGGELRSVSQLEKRMHETSKLGFSKILLPVNHREEVVVEGLASACFQDLGEALEHLFGVAPQAPSEEDTEEVESHPQPTSRRRRPRRARRGREGREQVA